MSTRLAQFFDTAVEAHPGLSGFSLLSQAREAFIVRLALADLAERSLDMQYYVWDGDTTGRIIVDRVMKAAERGVRVRLLVDDPYYNRSGDPVKAALDAHPNVEIRLFNPASNRRWTRLDFVVDFRRFNRRMHNKLMVADNAAAIVGGRNIGDTYYGVHSRRELPRSGCPGGWSRRPRPVRGFRALLEQRLDGTDRRHRRARPMAPPISMPS